MDAEGAQGPIEDGVFDDEAAWSAAADAAPVAVVGAVRLCLHMEINKGEEKSRIAREIARIEGEIVRVSGKLGNEAFVAKAPPAVIDQERKRLADFSSTIERLRDQVVRLG